MECRSSPVRLFNEGESKRIYAVFVILAGLDDFAVVKVCDIVDYQPWASDFCIDVDFTPTQCAMGGQWELAEAQYQPRHLEWSVGVQGSPVGSGLLDTIHESVWKDIGHPETNLSVFTTGSSQLEGLMAISSIFL